jgi:hypothetical protein
LKYKKIASFNNFYLESFYNESGENILGDLTIEDLNSIMPNDLNKLRDNDNNRQINQNKKYIKNTTNNSTTDPGAISFSLPCPALMNRSFTVSYFYLFIRQYYIFNSHFLFFT